MPSPKSKNPVRGGGSPVLGSSNGRYDFMSLTKPLNRSSPPHQRQGSDPATARLRASESPTRRRGSSSSTGSGQGLPEEDGLRLNPSFIRVALSSLLAIDLWMSKTMGVCACEDSSWGSVRPLMKLIEISGHGIPWLAGTAYCLYKSDSATGQEVMLNLFMGLLLDLVLVTIVKAVVRRRRPAHNRMDMFATFSVDRFSFPSGHATRAAMCGRFLLAHLVLAAPLRFLVVLWAALVGLSRVLLGRHNVTDVMFGFWMGYVQYNLIEMLWLSPQTLQGLLGQLA
ncbi:phospholipid phosphatase 6 [Gymnodraco acuticeps]|uniref:Polyisoprenoid diphosphate/phosphate phosphohydrolase PLPP6 n=3 Tax=Notothenioidei TaxID=8205 RepID=A0A6P8VHZ4_GYMAC|nr:PREDICTED: presqualene diphosphate phosphatase [Notothenia coriiceps]XP_034085578.1 phospholipid phosphatase 6 [Gymnodraco acuticeps]KAI9547801.1 Phospholipid phosphatase 6 [Dissostichus eleginoides]KAK1896844.1 Phospholipid phosphatase 6 [Dissostichus eleginoides]